MRLPRNGGYDGAGNPQLHRRHGATVLSGDGIPARGARTGRRRGVVGRAVLGPPVAPATCAAIAALAAVGEPRGLVTAGGHISVAIDWTGRRPHTVVPHVGTAAGPALPPAIVAVATGGSGAAARVGRAKGPAASARRLRRGRSGACRPPRYPLGGAAGCSGLDGWYRGGRAVGHGRPPRAPPSRWRRTPPRRRRHRGRSARGRRP